MNINRIKNSVCEGPLSFLMIFSFVLFGQIAAAQVEYTLLNLGPSMKTLSFSGGVIEVNDKHDTVFWGSTRTGLHGRLICYNISQNRVESIVELKDVSGAWGFLKVKDVIYIGSYMPAKLYSYTISSDKLELLTEFNDFKRVYEIEVRNDSILIALGQPYASLKLFNITTGVLSNLIDFKDFEILKSIKLSKDRVFLGLGTPLNILEYNLINKDIRTLTPEGLEEESFPYQFYKIFDGICFTTIPSHFTYYKSQEAKKFERIIENKSEEKDNLELAILPNGNILGETEGQIRLLDTDPLSPTLFGLIVFGEYIYGVSANGELIVYNFIHSNSFKKKLDLLDIIGGINSSPFSSIAHNGTFISSDKRLRFLNFNSKRDSYKIILDEPKVIAKTKNGLITANYPRARIWHYPDELVFNPNDENFSNTKYHLFNIGNNQNRPLCISVSTKDSNIVAVGTEPEYGDYGGALSIINLNTNVLFVYPNLIKGHSISSVVWDDKNDSIVYLGTTNSGGTLTQAIDSNVYIAKYNIYDNEIVWLTKIENGFRMNDLTIYQNNLLAFERKNGNAYSLNKIDGKILKSMRHRITSIIEDKENRFFCVAKGGLAILDPSTFELKSINITNAPKFREIMYDRVKDKIYLIDNEDYQLWEIIK